MNYPYQPYPAGPSPESIEAEREALRESIGIAWNVGNALSNFLIKAFVPPFTGRGLMGQPVIVTPCAPEIVQTAIALGAAVGKHLARDADRQLAALMNYRPHQWTPTPEDLVQVQSEISKVEEQIEKLESLPDPMTDLAEAFMMPMVKQQLAALESRRDHIQEALDGRTYGIRCDSCNCFLGEGGARVDSGRARRVRPDDLRATTLANNWYVSVVDGKDMVTCPDCKIGKPQ